MQLQTQTKTLVEHTLILTDEQLKKLLDDPYGFRDDVELALTGSNGIAKPKKRTVRQAQDFTIGRKPKKAKANGAGPKHARRVGAAFPKVPCSKCKRPIAQPQLARHESKCDGKAAYVLGFEISGDRFKCIWPVVKSKCGDVSAERRQAATTLYHVVKAKCLEAVVRGPRVAFAGDWLLPNGKTVAEMTSHEVADALPLMLSAPVSSR